MYYPGVQTVAQTVAFHAARQPDQVAILCAGRQVSYRTLHRESSRTARAILASGLHRGSRVAYLGKESEHYYEILFACAKSETVLVPINWRLTSAEIDYILRDSGAELAFVEREFMATVRDRDAFPRELFQQQHLVDIFARQPVGRVHVEPIDGAAMRRVAQPLQSRSQECAAAVAFIQKTQFVLRHESILFDALPQRRDLTANRHFISLALRTDASIQRDTQCVVHDVTHSLRWGPRSAAARTTRPVIMGDSGSPLFGAGATPAQTPAPTVGLPAGWLHTGVRSFVRETSHASPWQCLHENPLAAATYFRRCSAVRGMQI